MKRKFKDFERTEHGDNIADQIQTEDAYGRFNILTPADVWNILDQLETHLMDNDKRSNILPLLGKWKKQVEKLHPDVLDNY